MVAEEGAQAVVTGDSSIKGRVIGWLLKIRLWSGDCSGGGGCACASGLNIVPGSLEMQVCGYGHWGASV